MTIQRQALPRILIGASGSGCGKTTFTCGLLQALKDAGRKPMSFKCGPDYIDPMFHSEALGIPSRNLDLFFAEEGIVRYLMAKHSDKMDVAVVEGVMGYYDGLAGISSAASSYDLAVKTQTPAVLLLDGRGKSVSLLAEIKGFLELKGDSGIKGVILNRISAMLYPELKAMIEEQLPVTVYGYLPKMEDCTLESRHLGLVTAKEIKDLQQIICRLADQIRRTVDVEGLLRLAQAAPELCYEMPEPRGKADTSVRIGVAMDKAFCFYYQDNLDLLSQCGAAIIPFSPLEDEKLPENLHGLIFGGGYPELYLEQLSANRSMRQDIKEAVESDMPCLAECGGFMYLHEEMEDRQGIRYPMVGLVAGRSYPTGKLGRFGYITLTAREDTILCGKGEQLPAHEFHYWDSTNTGNAFLAQKPLRKKNWDCVITRKNLFAGYPHLYFYGNPNSAKNFVKVCNLFAEKS